MSTHTCHCGQRYAVVNNRTARPGYRETSQERVPDEDIFGRPTGKVRLTPSSRWIPQGEARPITRLPDDGGPTWTYTWTCGDHQTSIEAPAFDYVNCGRCAEQRKSSYTYDRPARVCSCCYDNPRHAVPRDPDGRHMPACLTDKATAA